MATETHSQETTDAGESPRRRFVESFLENKLAVFGLFLIVSVAVLTVLAPQIAPYSAREQNYDAVLEGKNHQFEADEEPLEENRSDGPVERVRLSQVAG